MTTIQFQQIKDLAGVMRSDMVIYTDDNGQVWTVPQNHRFWTEIYEPWLAAGNTPLPPA